MSGRIVKIMYQPEQQYTLAEYWKLVETFPQHKYEYVDGYVRMMTGGSPSYAQLQARLSYLLTAALEDSECNIYGPDAIVRVAERRYYCPDTSVSCDPADWTRQKELLL